MLVQARVDALTIAFKVGLSDRHEHELAVARQLAESDLGRESWQSRDGDCLGDDHLWHSHDGPGILDGS